MRANFIFAIVAICSLLVGCGSKQAWPPTGSDLTQSKSDYDAALADATNSIPYAADFVRLFPDSANFFSYYLGGAGSSSLNMQTYLFERYQLVMKIAVNFNQNRRKVSGFGEPEFLLRELSEIGRAATGNLTIRYNAEGQRRFGASEWKQIVGAGGNFSVIGYKFVTNSPVPRFEDLRQYEEMQFKKEP